MPPEIVSHNHPVTPEMRSVHKGHRPLVLWFTGLSGSGKSTVAGALEMRLHTKGFHTILLDGDNVRGGLNRDLGLAPHHRKENIRRIGEVAGLFLDAGIVTLCAFISPFQRERDDLRAKFGERFIEIHVNTPLATCQARDPKGLYAKASRGLLSGMTGIDAPYEPPINPEISLDTSQTAPDTCAEWLLDRLTPLLGLHPSPLSMGQTPGPERG